ncbi:hypothetical protein KIH27_20285 [Mycobacterium sp. M1]|uniref:DUF222 domain-containing protein n=1 Tax=Mycolicibacter acidiphilus TaxID=2835306 RepID=A0ABS5RNP9_9MYCO|nr:hypothetical protein [Mycolicibacter acidiphilus]MBS9535925.1 hypothetical protein [Mycolicibacter acidiphilus]
MTTARDDRFAGDLTAAIASAYDASLVADMVCARLARNQEFTMWATIARDSLAGLLYAASPVGHGGGIAWVQRALSSTDTAALSDRIDGLSQRMTAGRPHGLRISGLDSRQRDSIVRTLKEAVAPYGRNTSATPAV